MKGIQVYSQPGDVPHLVWEEVPDVPYGADEVLVRVRATAVNRADLLQAQGGYNPPPGASPILGLEMAGEITAVGENVRHWHIGDRVCALLPGGGYAQYAAVPSRLLLPIPTTWDFAQAAAVPEAWLTAYVNMLWEGELQPGQTILIHAGASGVGTAAIQLANLHGATPIVTVGSSAKAEACLNLGAALAIPYKEQNFADEVLAFTQGQGVDVVLDCVGGSYLARHLQILAPKGRLVFIGLMGGRTAEIDLAPLMAKRLRLVGSVLRPRPLEEKILITEEFRTDFWRGFEEGLLEPVIDTTFDITAAQEAHAYVRQNRNIGKVVLLVGE